MPRGRKPKYPLPDFIKNPPQYILDYCNSLKGKVELKKQHDFIIRNSNLWRQLRKNGLTPEYLEMFDITDPELMPPDQLLTWKAAKLKYLNAIQKLKDAKEQILNVQRRGGESTHQKSKENYRKLIDNFPCEIGRCISGELSSTQAFRSIKSKVEGKRASNQAFKSTQTKMDELWIDIWDGSKNGPSLRTFRHIIKTRAKATPPKK